MIYKYLILGAGPAGLTFANKLKDAGESSFLVLEKESEGGGLCRSEVVDGAPLDIGGGHFLDVRRPEVNKFLFEFMPEDEWDIYMRDSRISLGEEEIHHPMESNIWELGLKKQVDYLKSIAVAGCNLGMDMPSEFVNWIYWKLGRGIAEDYMIPYNQKMFGENLNALGTYWMEKLPNVSFEETLLSCLTKKAYGTQPGHASFYYPKKYGYGELWLRMAEAIKDKVVYNTDIQEIDLEKHFVCDSNGNRYEAKRIITTIPWLSFLHITGMPAELIQMIRKLKYSSVQIDYYPKNLDTDAHWIYYPDLELSYHRILVRHNFCPGSRGYWTETNRDRLKLAEGKSSFSYLNEFAYPLNTLEKPEIMKRVLNYAAGYDVFGLGRWGEHEHYNSDVTVKRAMDLFDEIHH